jgi:hypothetical protein
MTFAPGTPQRGQITPDVDRFAMELTLFNSPDLERDYGRHR